MALITLQEYKDFHSLRKTDEDAKIQFLINSVSALIKAYIGRDLSGTYEEITEHISLDYETDVIYLDKYPVNDIISISEPDHYTLDSTVHVLLYEGSDYYLNKSQGTLTRIRGKTGFARWPVSPSHLTVTYSIGDPDETPGSISTTIPADIKLATIEIVDYYKSEEFRQSKTIMSSTIVNTLAKGDTFPQHIQVILDRYK